MADTLATYYVRIAPSAQGLGGSLVDELSGAGEQGGKKSGGRFASAFKAVVASAAIGSVFKQALSAGGELEQSIGGITKIFGDAGKEVEKNAAAAFQTAGLSANDYMQTVTGFSARLLQGLEGDTQAAASYADMAIRDMADNANTFGTSMDSLQAAYQGFAKGNFTLLDNLKLGYGGTNAEMVRLLNDTGVHVNGAKVTLENLNKVPLDQIIGAIHKVQEESQITGTTANEAAGTLQGSTATMQAAWENLLGYIATGSPMAADAANDLFNAAVNVVENALPMIGRLIEQLPEMLGTVLEKLGPKIEEYSQRLPGVITKLANIIIKNLPTIISAGVSLIGSLAKGIVSAVPTLIKQLPTIVKAILQGLVELFKGGVDVGRNLVEGLWNGIKNAKEWVLDKIRGFGKGILNGLKSFFGIKSPSKVMRDEIGRYLAEGVGVGFEKYMPEDQINNALYSTFDDVKQTMGTFDADLAVNAAYATNGIASGGFASTNYGGVAINVYATDGQNARSIANEVMDILQRDINRNRAVFE